MSQTNKEVCRNYQQRKREQDTAADRRRTAARTRRQSKREAPANPIDDLADWCTRRLKIPAGHALAGKPMELPRFALDFLRECLQPDCKTGYLLVARKNSKSSSLAAFILAHLADGGPLRKAGFRCAVVSITKPKAAELKQ